MRHQAARGLTSALFMVIGIALLGALLGGPALAQQAQPTPGQEGYVPLKDLPSSESRESLPAVPLVVGAYAFVWAVLVAYLWSIWRRLSRVQADLADLERRVVKGRRP